MSAWWSKLADVGLTEDNFITNRKQIGELRICLEWQICHPLIPNIFWVWVFITPKEQKYWSYIGDGVHENPPEEVVDLIRYAVKNSSMDGCGFVPVKIMYDVDKWNKANQVRSYNNGEIE